MSCSNLLMGSPFTWLLSEEDFQRTTCNYAFVVNPCAVHGLSVQQDFLHIDVLVGILVRDDSEGLSIADVERGILHYCTSYLPLAAAWLHLIETKGREDIPSRHLTNILVATKTCWLIGIKFIHYLSYSTGSLPRLSNIII